MKYMFLHRNIMSLLHCDRYVLYDILYGLVYLGIVIFITPQTLLWWYKASFWLFAIFLFWTSRFWNKEQSELSNKWFVSLFVSTVLILVFTRVFPFIYSGQAPLGYDTGIYLRNFEQAINKQLHDPLSILVQLFFVSGFSINAILHGLLVVFNILLGFTLYTTSKSIFHNRLIALSTFFLFTLSIAQYEAYIWMFYRMMISIVLFMAATALMAHRSWLVILVGGFAGALHPATFLVFGITYIVYLVILIIGRWWKRKDGYFWYAIVSGCGILIVALFFNFSEFRDYLPYLTEYRLQPSSFDFFLSSELTGSYLNFYGFRASTLFYTPFTLLGISFILRRIKEWWQKPEAQYFLFLFSWLSVTLFLIISRIIFYQRYLIILDLLIIIFASVAFGQLVEYFKGIRMGQTLLMVFVLGFLILTIYYDTTRKPWIPPDELRELKEMSIRLEPEAYGMATHSYYTPWVYGYLTSHTIAPGYFINYWSFEEWKDFWYKGTDEKRFELLSRYGTNPLYIFVGSKQDKYKPMQDFLSRNATQVSRHIWKYEYRN